MQPNRDVGRTIATPGVDPNSSGFPVASRRAALRTLRKEFEAERTGSLLLLTGEPGVGKTWLWRRLVAELPSSWRWAEADATGDLDGLELLRLIAHELEVEIPDQLGGARLTVRRALQDEAAEHRDWILVLESAGTLSDQIMTEALALIHAMESGRGFAAIMLVGPTELANQLAHRRQNALASRINAHVHLLPLDLNEAQELGRNAGGAFLDDQDVLEALHRDTRGNPRRILQAVRKLAGASIGNGTRPVTSLPRNPEARSIGIEKASRSELTTPVPLDRGKPAAVRPESGTAVPTPSVAESISIPDMPLLPSHPPLRVEDGLIEVGWEGDLEEEAEDDGPVSDAAFESHHESADEPETEEAIEDHYAALQAWTEWARNRGRTASPPSESSSVEAPDEDGNAHEGVSGRGNASENMLGHGIRVEAEHEHAPYSQLFSRLRQSH